MNNLCDTPVKFDLFMGGIIDDSCSKWSCSYVRIALTHKETDEKVYIPNSTGNLYGIYKNSDPGCYSNIYLTDICEVKEGAYDVIIEIKCKAGKFRWFSRNGTTSLVAHSV
jgi:hypothetical protein